MTVGLGGLLFEVEEDLCAVTGRRGLVCEL